MANLSRTVGLLRRGDGFKPLLAFICEMSSASTESRPQKISKNLSFRPATESRLNDNNRPIVLIYGWLVAKAKHIYKYGDFYLGKGFDVLHIKVEPLQLLWPQQAQKVVGQVADFVTHSSRIRQPILIHGFSVGGYLYGETIVKFTSDAERFHDMSNRIRGQVFDSPVDFEGVPRGVGLAMTANPVLQKTIKASLDGYLGLFKNQVTQHYIRSSDAFHRNPLRSPSLVFYSRNDPIGTPGPIETLMGNWSRQGIPVTSRCWDDTPHVSHFLHHPVQYIGALNSFLDSIGLQQQKGEPDKAVMSK